MGDVMLTGATGFVGQELLARLLTPPRPSGCRGTSA